MISTDKARRGLPIEENNLQASSRELEAKAQQLLEKKAESRTRTYTGPMNAAVTVLLCIWTAFQLYYSTIGTISAMYGPSVHGTDSEENL